MINLIKYSLVVILLCTQSFYGYASHIKGNDFTYQFLGMSGSSYHYRVTLTIYEDCHHGDPSAIDQDNPAYICLYKQGSLIPAKIDSVFYSSATTTNVLASNTCNNSLDAEDLCMIFKKFTTDYYLPASSAGYIAVWQRCCMEASVVNIMNSSRIGTTAFCIIPPSNITDYNTSAAFTNYPPLVIAVDTPLAIDFSATDVDGDSLTYDFDNPYSGGSDNDARPIPAAPPYTPVTYIAPLSFSNPMNCSVPLSINPKTGVLTGTANKTGDYLIAIRCNEWRNGKLINTVRRGYIVTVVKCLYLHEKEIDIFPNPATGIFNVMSKDKISGISIYNMWGQMIYSATYNNVNQVQLELAGLPKGLYFAKINGILKRLEKL